MEKEFENYWKHHQSELIQRAPQALKEERENTGRMNTAGDWILFVVPIIAMVGFMNYGFFAQEMVNFLIALVIGIFFFFLSMLLKPYITGKDKARKWLSGTAGMAVISAILAGLMALLVR